MASILRRSRLLRRVCTGAFSVGATVALTASPASANILGDMAGALAPAVSAGSSDFGLQDLLKRLFPDSGGTTGKTRCTSVIQIGDSTSVAADNASMLAGAANTASAQYKRVGATSVTVDAVSGRAVVGGPSPDAEHAVASRLAAGARGCWVIAMGVNDSGAISSGSSVTADQRIARIMTQLSGQPVLWPTVMSSNPAKPAFNAAAMNTFNDALRRAAGRYSNLAVYDWAGAAKPNLYAGDGIHYTAAGTTERNKRFADALAASYPSGAVGATPTAAWIR
ncbi:SGNH/GDSL hydrolase family protein [Gordonia asplenii]|uniref:SGNH/GDSL hydrolase family protein n=1 Tax=Gordonia asplenii TaxID=2725283 RepID=UPI0028B1A0D7|nr:SGNH/GDSL hydrolase family protein [Gordonia asplenii]